jgi:DNA-binding beta-propeller fold protein YncE
VISGQTNTVTATIPVGNGPVGVAVNPLTGAVYTANVGDDTVSVIFG